MGYLQGLDRRLTFAVRRLPVDWQPFVKNLSSLGEPVIVLSVGLAGLLAATIRKQTNVWQAFIYAMIAFFIGVILKRLIHRARPDHLSIASFGLKSYSFPSGHAFGSVIFYGLFAIVDMHRLPSPWQILSAVVIWSSIFLIGVSRVYLKAHYPTDVLGGWLFGGLALYIIAQLKL